MIPVATSQRRPQRRRNSRAPGWLWCSWLSLGLWATANAADNVVIFVDGMSFSATGIPILLDSSGLSLIGISISEWFVGPQPFRSENYLVSDSVLPGLIRAKVPSQLHVDWNGDLRDKQATVGAVNSLKTMICAQRGHDVDIISHSLGTVIAYTALAELAGISGARSTPACASTRIVSFVTLASPLGLDDTLPASLGTLSGIQIPPLANVRSAHALRIIGRWLNVYASGDRIGGKIDIPSVVNVSFSLDQSTLNPVTAHSFPYKDPDSVRLIADVILGVHARIPPNASVMPPVGSTASVLPVTSAAGAPVVAGSDSQVAIPAGMVGTWNGVVSQPGLRYPVTMELQVGGAGALTGTIEYPSLSCGGRLDSVGQKAGGVVTLREAIERGSCINGGLVQLSMGSSAALVWKWYFPDGREGATATLTRKTPNVGAASSVSDILARLGPLQGTARYAAFAEMFSSGQVPTPLAVADAIAIGHGMGESQFAYVRVVAPRLGNAVTAAQFNALAGSATELERFKILGAVEAGIGMAGNLSVTDFNFMVRDMLNYRVAAISALAKKLGANLGPRELIEILGDSSSLMKLPALDELKKARRIRSPLSEAEISAVAASFGILEGQAREILSRP